MVSCGIRDRFNWGLAHPCFLLVPFRERLPQPSRFSKAGHSDRWEQEILSAEDQRQVRRSKAQDASSIVPHPANIAQSGAASVVAWASPPLQKTQGLIG